MATKFITVSIEIMHDKKLSPNQKFILAEIGQLSQLDKGCIASNRHFSELVGISLAGVSNAISDLVKKGYILIDNSNTKRNYGRVITIHSDVDPLHSENKDLHSDVETKENKTINKTINKEHPLITEYKKEVSNYSESEIFHLSAFVEYRKTIKAVIKTIAPLKSYWKVIVELHKLNYNIKECIDYMKEKEWQTLSVDYLKNTDIKPKNDSFHSIPEGFR